MNINKATLADLEISVRSFGALLRALGPPNADDNDAKNISASQVAALLDDDKLQKLRGIGKKSAKEIREALELIEPGFTYAPGTKARAIAERHQKTAGIASHIIHTASGTIARIWASQKENLNGVPDHEAMATLRIAIVRTAVVCLKWAGATSLPEAAFLLAREWPNATATLKGAPIQER